MLSVVAQQIHTIQHAVAHNIKQFMFEGVELTLNNSCSIFITMNTSVGADDREVRRIYVYQCPLCVLNTNKPNFSCLEVSTRNFVVVNGTNDLQYSFLAITMLLCISIEGVARQLEAPVQTRGYDNTRIWAHCRGLPLLRGIYQGGGR